MAHKFLTTSKPTMNPKKGAISKIGHCLIYTTSSPLKKKLCPGHDIKKSATMGDVYMAPLLPSHDTYDVRGALQMPTRAQERDQCPGNIKNTIITVEWKGYVIQ